MTAHTPGPWFACPAQWNHGETTVIQDKDGDIIAHVEGQRFPHTEANATLLAAATDLLEALAYALPLLAESPGANEMYRRAAERKALAAIAKATA